MIRCGAVYESLLLVVSLFIGSTYGMECYNLEANADGTCWGIDRSTQTLNFNIEGNVVGSGNFSRNNYINRISGVNYREKSSAVWGGNVSLEDNMQLAAREGPVLIKYNLESIFVGDKEYGRLKTVIDERWINYFRNYNTINYAGHGVRTYERYDDNGEITSTYSNSWKLSKESGYITSNDRTIILTEVAPGSVAIDRFSNKSSTYSLDLSSIGSITCIDLMSTRPTDENVYDVSEESVSRNTQEYSGLVETTLTVSDFSSFSLNGNNTINGNGKYPNYLNFSNNDTILIRDDW